MWSRLTGYWLPLGQLALQLVDARLGLVGDGHPGGALLALLLADGVGVSIMVRIWRSWSRLSAMALLAQVERAVVSRRSRISRRSTV